MISNGKDELIEWRFILTSVNFVKYYCIIIMLFPSLELYAQERWEGGKTGNFPVD